jgi:hypothetical protein
MEITDMQSEARVRTLRMVVLVLSCVVTGIVVASVATSHTAGVTETPFLAHQLDRN